MPKGCAHVVAFRYWYENERWHGQLVYKEERMGSQYGGAVVDKFLGPKGCGFDRFVKLARDRATAAIKTFWT